MSVLEHEWMIIFEAESAHDIESLCIDAGLGTFNTVKIVGLKRYDDVHNKIGKGKYVLAEYEKIERITCLWMKIICCLYNY